MELGIGKIIKDGNGNALIFTALAAAALANLVPTPADALYFARQQKLKADLEDGKISIENYWWHDISGYYIYTAGYYLALFGVLYAMNNTQSKNIKIMAALVGAGVVVGVGFLNIKKDKEIAEIRKTMAAKNPIIPTLDKK